MLPKPTQVYLSCCNVHSSFDISSPQMPISITQSQTTSQHLLSCTLHSRNVFDEMNDTRSHEVTSAAFNRVHLLKYIYYNRETFLRRERDRGGSMGGRVVLTFRKYLIALVTLFFIYFVTSNHHSTQFLFLFLFGNLQSSQQTTGNGREQKKTTQETRRVIISAGHRHWHCATSSTRFLV